MATNPIQALPPLGTLNRVLTHLTFASYSALNVQPANLGKSYASLNFEGNFAEQLEQAVGVVNSEEPYVMGTVSFGLLRTQALGAAWLTQVQTSSILGNMTIFPDSAAFPAITLVDTVIRGFDPGAFDGMDPVIKVTLRGVFYPNSDAWG